MGKTKLSVDKGKDPLKNVREVIKGMRADGVNQPS